MQKSHLAGTDDEYRLPFDGPHVIRLNQQWPEGIGAAIFNMCGELRDGIPVAGVSQRKAKKNLSGLIYGTARRIELVRDPDNPHDKNAIKVIGYWRDSEGMDHQGHIGWVPAGFADDIAEHNIDVPLGAIITLMYQPWRGRNPGIRLNIGRPRKKPKRRTYSRSTKR